MKHFASLLFLLFFTIPLSAQNEGDQFFSEWTVHEIRFQFAQTGYWDSLSHNYTLDAYMACQVTVDGVVYPKTGVKYKGNSSYNNQSKKKPFRIDFSEYIDSQAHEGLKKLVLNNAFKDPTFLREKLMLDFLQAHGIPAPRATFARLYVNDHYWGLYSVVEDVNKTFLKDRFDNKGGNLFKGDPKGTLTWKGWDQTLYQTDYELKTNETQNDWSDLIRLSNALNNSTAAQLPDSLGKYLNLDSWFSYWAAHNLFVNLDSYVGSGHNYFIYHNTDTDKFEWITWDVNEAFANFQMGITPANLKTLPFTFIPQPPNQRPIMNRLLMDANFKQDLADRLCTLLSDFTNAALDPHIDSLADLIRPHVYADTLKFFTNTAFEQNLSQDLNIPGTPGGSGIAGLKPFIAARHTSLATQLGAYGCTFTDVAESFDNESIELYPNPAQDVVQVNANRQQLTALNLWSTDGRLLRSWDAMGATTIQLSLLDFPPGIFYLSVNTGDMLHLRRLVKMR